MSLRAPLKTQFKNLRGRFFSETGRQKRSLAALNKYFDNQVSGKKIISKIESGFLEVPLIKRMRDLSMIAEAKMKYLRDHNKSLDQVFYVLKEIYKAIV